MRVLLSEHSGFCFGVQRAIQIVEEHLQQTKKLYLLGPIIHNPQEVARLEHLGAKTITDIDGLEKDSHIVISTHGVSPAVITRIQQKGLHIIDTTCPIVKKAQSAASRLDKEGYTVIIVGKSSHPEVLGIKGHIKGPCYVVQVPENIPSFNKNQHIGVVAQTTMSEESFNDVVASVTKQIDKVNAVNTICNATRLRQEAAIELAGKADIMLVIGGYNSANTRRLYELCRNILKETYHIESIEQIKSSWFSKARTAGITAGASTPDWIVNEIVEYVINIDA